MWAYTYNPDGTRASKTIEEETMITTTYHIWDGSNIVMDNNVFEFAYGEGFESLLKYYRGIHLIKNNNKYYIYDNYGDIIATVSASGNVSEAKEYNAFGVTEMSYEPFGYRGEYTDYETGFVYLRNRYYNPETGRFLTEDPIQDGLNWYAYCNNNPIMFVDPWGLNEVPIRSYVENRGGSITFKEGTTRLYFGVPLQNLNTSITVNMNGKSATYYGFSNIYTIKSDGLAYIDDSVLINDFNISDERLSFRDLIDAIGFMESSDNYQAVNSLGYLGRYQFGGIALQDIGYKDQNGNWTSTANNLGIYSNQDFLNNPAVQDQAMNMLLNKNWNYITNLGLQKYIGVTMNGITITESGLVAAAHLVGIGALQQALNNGDLSSAADANGTTALKYMKQFGGYNIDQIK